MHYQTPSKRHRAWGGALWILGFCAEVSALVWPPVVERIAHSRWGLGLLAVWCFALSGHLSGCWAAFADAFREDWDKNDDDDLHAT